MRIVINADLDERDPFDAEVPFLFSFPYENATNLLANSYDAMMIVFWTQVAKLWRRTCDPLVSPVWSTEARCRAFSQAEKPHG
jgi:hypothetical protein